MAKQSQSHFNNNQGSAVFHDNNRQGASNEENTLDNTYEDFNYNKLGKPVNRKSSFFEQAQILNQKKLRKPQQF